MFIALPTNVRIFPSSGAAYDACNCDETMTAGTIFMVPSERIVAVSWAWPVAVTREAGHLHSLEGDPRSARLDPKVEAAVPAAAALAVSLGFALSSFASMMAYQNGGISERDWMAMAETF